MEVIPKHFMKGQPSIITLITQQLLLNACPTTITQQVPTM